MKRPSLVVLAAAALGTATLGGCAAFSQEHPTTESRYMSPAEQAYWVDSRSRHDQADLWAWQLEQQRAARMGRYLAN